jgi:hypothetical protein
MLQSISKGYRRQTPQSRPQGKGELAVSVLSLKAKSHHDLFAHCWEEWPVSFTYLRFYCGVEGALVFAILKTSQSQQWWREGADGVSLALSWTGSVVMHWSGRMKNPHPQNRLPSIINANSVSWSLKPYQLMQGPSYWWRVFWVV